MLFNSFQFALFFAGVLALLGTFRRQRTRVLLFVSLLFYGLWIPLELVLLLCTLVINYGLVRAMARSRYPRRYLAASVVFTLTLLALFKYAEFGVELLRPVIPAVSALDPGLVRFALPLGISFYSFEIISLSVDISRGALPCPSFGRYALFVTFFPHLIAGPIMRGSELLPQFEGGGEQTASRFRRGVWLFGVGLVKKTLLADALLVPFVNEVFGAPGALGGPAHLLGMYSYAFQIYLDFSGYTDMARGIACMLGFELPMNFEEPYLSRDPSEFWRRWHITLSRWLRDYLYIPLGGNRSGRARTVGNLMLTMALGGLWHGAGMNFLVWGCLHGAMLSVYRAVGGKTGDAPRPLRLSDAPRVVLLFHLVCLAWIPFRTSSWRDTAAYFGGLFSTGYLRTWPILPALIVLLCGLLHGVERVLRLRLPTIHARLAQARWGPVAEGLALGIVLATVVAASGSGVQFVYVNF